MEHFLGVRANLDAEFGRFDLYPEVGQHGARLGLDPRPEIRVVPVAAGSLDQDLDVVPHLGREQSYLQTHLFSSSPLRLNAGRMLVSARSRVRDSALIRGSLYTTEPGQLPLPMP